MNKTTLWHGVYPALLTPFTADGAIDYEMFKKNFLAQIDAGVSGLIIAGTLGEASTLSRQEKFDLLVFAKQHVPDHIPVVLNIAEQTTAEAVSIAKEAERLGANALMLLPPMRYKASDREVVHYFKTIANATNLAIMIYNNPVDYAIHVTVDMFAELAECPNIQAVKESTRDLTNITRMINRFGDRFKVLGGVDTIALESQLVGAHGSVAGLVDAFPRETVAIYRLAGAGRLDEALAIYRWFMPLLELDIHPRLVQYIKLAATAEGLSNEYVRAPRLTLEGEERARIQKIIDDAIATRPLLPDYLNLPLNTAVEQAS
ncbi:dihydrodipicolinate synthase family protein [Parapedobacter sp. ISTM3]|uniref:4-hydroxy-tetrahydrodipicolinate synthase n=1 Tax=Parapedobacter luteus TaxID=623280 RepID=A0A1T4ZUK5_9SPHI|nr:MULTISPECIES: dihydrodipicolinate synthase family protein [Parapedobacter]MBK1438636.1 dihydrodipicolinate synthase family protein [Parapedobacter sp. ISTM3]SKB26189.1 4-hydroxy-tetrahydrodipicolinate synthase [Parapedobacter luteus]